ncbi:MAG: pyruvate kinase [Bacteroidota bacterium]
MDIWAVEFEFRIETLGSPCHCRCSKESLHSAKDKKDLPFVVKHADIINFSFVNRPSDVLELNKEMKKRNVKNKLGIVLKIETKIGYNQLTHILLEAMKGHPIGVMIARGDLAVESGWENIGQEQEEILSICQAAHITDIWATQVLESLAKTGLPSRAEITDAVASQRADCVMLNKGPHITEAIKLLDTIFTGMGDFIDRNKTLSPKMKRL